MGMLLLYLKTFGHFVGTIAKFLAGIFTGQETMILSSITACEATTMTLFLYSANLLLLLVHPRVKQWWLRNALPKMKGLVNPSHTTNLCVKQDGPILKLTITEAFMPMSWPFAVLTFMLLSETWPSKPRAVTVSYLMQLTCVPVSNNEENAKPSTFILNVVPLVLTVWINKTSLLFHYALLL